MWGCRFSLSHFIWVSLFFLFLEPMDIKPQRILSSILFPGKWIIFLVFHLRCHSRLQKNHAHHCNEYDADRKYCSILVTHVLQSWCSGLLTEEKQELGRWAYTEFAIGGEIISPCPIHHPMGERKMRQQEVEKWQAATHLPPTHDAYSYLRILKARYYNEASHMLWQKWLSFLKGVPFLKKTCELSSLIWPIVVGLQLLSPLTTDCPY